MTKEEIVDIIKKFLIEEFEVEEDLIEPEANLQETLGLDSLDFVDLVVVIENNFGFKVKAEDFADIQTFQDFYNYIEAKVRQTAVDN